MLDRARAAFDYSKRTWAEDPAARGAAKMGAGGLLVADAVFNIRGRVANRARVGRRSSDKPTGILGSLLFIGVGVVLVVVGLTVARPSWSDEAVTTPGEIIGVEESVRQTDEGTERLFSGVIAFTDEGGQRHEFVDQVASSSRPTVGATVEVTYEPFNPAGTAQRTDGFRGRIHWAFIGGGALMSLLAFVDFSIRVVMIVLGVMLIRSGRRDRAEAGDQRGRFFSDLVRLMWDSKHRQDDAADRVAASGDLQADLVELVTGNGERAPHPGGAPAQTGAPAAPPPPPQTQPAGPRPGWYESPTDEPGVLRWWDGAAWTQHTHAGSTAAPDPAAVDEPG